MKRFLKNFDKYSDKQLILLAVSFGIIGFILVATTFFKPEYYSMGIGLGAIFIIVSIYFLVIMAIRDKPSNENTDIKPEKPKVQNVISTSKNAYKYNSKLTICKACGKEIVKTAVACPHCGCKTQNAITKQTTSGIVAVVIILVVIVFIIIIPFSFNRVAHNSSQTETPKINLTQIENQLKKGMSYSECCEILGTEGELLTHSKVADNSGIIDVDTSIYKFSISGSTIMLTFKNDKLATDFN